MNMDLAILGLPSSGKTSLCNSLLEAYPALRRFNAGHFFRGNLARDPILQRKGTEALMRGQKLPDALVRDALREMMEKSEGQGLVLDGTPHNEDQALLIDDLFHERARCLAPIVIVEVPVEVCRLRAGRRRVCQVCGGEAAARQDGGASCAKCGGALVQRADDSHSTLVARIGHYTEWLARARDFYAARDLLVVDGSSPAARVFREVARYLEGHSPCGGRS